MAHVAGLRSIRRLLVANRGEIARRIFRTARQLGMGTLAVYAEGEETAPFVREADLAVALVGRSAAETYLDPEQLLEACRIGGADAVHPGYGFLSENAAFARAVLDAGLVWVGPSPEVIAQMGDKLAAKRLMREAGVPTLEARELKDGEDPLPSAEAVGYPLLVKASAGGGGRGMRVVRKAAELPAALESAGREALHAFGDGTLFLEPWLEEARHLEVQLLGDLHGGLVHCFERECSIQRRHQKIIEEAPAPTLDAGLRARLHEAALAAARHLGYASAGTVEFLVSGGDFFFLEINARLQVEHPVTEAVTGLDLVREQLRVAEGEPLGFSQADLAVRGHAIEARLYAEDPERNFLPTPGRVGVWRPSAVGGARFDSGVETGSEVSPEFDPMLAKVIVHAPARREAAARLAGALEQTRIQGLTTNRDFLVNILRTPEFLAGDTTTDFIKRVAPAGTGARSREVLVEAALAAAMAARTARRDTARVQASIPGGWRNSVMPAENFTCSHQGDEISLDYLRQRDGSFLVQVDDRELRLRVHAADRSAVDLQLDRRRLAFAVQASGAEWLVRGPDGDITLLEAPRFPPPGEAEAGGARRAPMPGRVLAVEVGAGDRVGKGQTLLVMEAMKMEHRITAPHDCVVEQLHVRADEQVTGGQLLVTLADS